MARSRFIPIALMTVVVAGVLLAMLVMRTNHGFPALPAGTYVGVVKGLSWEAGDKDKSEEVTLYLERPKYADVAILILFEDGFTPKLIHLVEKNDGSNGREFYPLYFEHQFASFRLFGKATRVELSGQIVRDDNQRGTWTLKRVSSDQLASTQVAAEGISIDLARWLRARAKHKDTSEQLAQINSELDTIEKSNAELKEYASDEQLVKTRAEENKKALLAELESARKLDQQNRKDVAGMVNELAMLGRITKRGRTVGVARRLARRRE